MIVALAQLDLGAVDAAREAVEQRLEISKQVDGDPNFALALGRVLLATHRVDESIEVFKKLSSDWQSINPDSPYASEVLYWFGMAYAAGGNPRGRQIVQQARAALAKSPVPSHRVLAAAGR